MLGLSRHHVLLRTVVALVVYGERRRITLGQGRGMIPNKTKKNGGAQGRRERRKRRCVERYRRRRGLDDFTPRKRVG